MAGYGRHVHSPPECRQSIDSRQHALLSSAYNWGRQATRWSQNSKTLRLALDPAAHYAAPGVAEQKSKDRVLSLSAAPYQQASGSKARPRFADVLSAGRLACRTMETGKMRCR